jgi:hypothetical protein
MGWGFAVRDGESIGNGQKFDTVICEALPVTYWHQMTICMQKIAEIAIFLVIFTCCGETNVGETQ